MLGDDLLRNTYCIFGMPIDVIGMPAVVRLIEEDTARNAHLVISTPNLNFLVNTRSDPFFRESLLDSDLCPADGMPIVWLGRMIGVPIEARIAGADIFDVLKSRHDSERPLKVFLFGGPEGVAVAACRALNATPGGLRCVGSLYPGYVSVDEMSRDGIIDRINSSGADFLVVSLGAQKGQAWLQRNHNRVSVPIQTHLGAAINFQAGTVKRAPSFIRKMGLEWLWRIKEEPYLWKRYWGDGTVLLRMLFLQVLPVVIWTNWIRFRCARAGNELLIAQTQRAERITLTLSGPAIARNAAKLTVAFRQALGTRKKIVIDFSKTSEVDARFLGLLLMLRKTVRGRGAELLLMGLSRRLKAFFRLNGLEFLLTEDGRV